MREDAKFIHHVIAPEDVRILGRGLHFRFARADHVLPFVHEWPLIAIGLSVEVEA